MGSGEETVGVPDSEGERHAIPADFSPSSASCAVVHFVVPPAEGEAGADVEDPPALTEAEQAVTVTATNAAVRKGKARATREG